MHTYWESPSRRRSSARYAYSRRVVQMDGMNGTASNNGLALRNGAPCSHTRFVLNGLNGSYGAAGAGPSRKHNLPLLRTAASEEFQ